MTLKNKKLIILTTIFFILVNTTYYWEVKLGFFALPAILLLVLSFFGLIIALIGQLYFAIKEKLSNKIRLYTIGLLILVLTLTFFKPFGLINFDKLEGGDILVAEREGAANCMTTLKLKEDFTFSERNYCFGVSEIKGTYRYQNDTIYFDNIELGRGDNEYYKFAIIETLKFDKSNKKFNIVRFKNKSDTLGHELWITKNDLKKLNHKRQYR